MFSLVGHAWGRVAFSALTRNQCLPLPSLSFCWNTALIPEEAESALEATHYFTEDSPSEGEPLPRHPAQPTMGLQPPVFPRGLCREPAVPLWTQGACHPGVLPGRALQHFLGQVGPVDVLNHCFSCISVSLDLASPSALSTNPLLSLPASPLASDLDLFLPWEAQGQSLEGRGDPFTSRLCLPLFRSLETFLPRGLFGTSSCGDKS